jgi:hypothetical protein
MKTRRLTQLSVVAALFVGAQVGQANPAGATPGTGPGGWAHLGHGATAGSASLNAAVSAVNTDVPGSTYVGGAFTNAGGLAAADRIAVFRGGGWQAVGSSTSKISNGLVDAIAIANPNSASRKVFAGGTFQNAGGNANADFLAVWDGSSWQPFCSVTATVYALQIIGSTLYVAGAFADGGGIPSADRVLACDIATGAPSTTVVDAAHAFSGTVYALAADSNGRLYAGGGFTDLGSDPAADNVAYMDGSGWHAMGSGGGACSCAVNDFVRSLTARGTNVYVGTDAVNVAGIAQADHVVRWNGSSWSALGSNGSGDGWFPASAFIYGLDTTAFVTNVGTAVFATGSFQNAGGDARADAVVYFDGTRWHRVGSDGAGNGPWGGNGLAISAPNNYPIGAPHPIFAGGNFTSAGGDSQAEYAASFDLDQLTGPQVSGYGLSPTRFKAASSGPATGATRTGVGTRVDFSLAHRSTVKFTVQRAVEGRLVGGRCVRTTAANSGNRHCTRWLSVSGSFTIDGTSGANHFRFRGRIGGNTLRPHHYRLTTGATALATYAVAPKHAGFTIVS